MNYLIDTHYLLWIFLAPEKISLQVQNILLNTNNIIFYSPISLWEISIKFSLGKLSLGDLSPETLYKEISRSFLRCLAFTNEEFITCYHLPTAHSDPFDRALIWQALTNEFIFISSDRKMHKYVKHGLKLIF